MAQIVTADAMMKIVMETKTVTVVAIAVTIAAIAIMTHQQDRTS